MKYKGRAAVIAAIGAVTAFFCFAENPKGVRYSYYSVRYSYVCSHAGPQARAALQENRWKHSVSTILKISENLALYLHYYMA